MAKIIGNPTVTPMAIPEKLSEFVNDIDSLPSVVYTELDNFTDGVCKVIPKSPDEPLYFSDIRGGFTEEDNIYVESETFALCIANAKYFDESEQYRLVAQILILPGQGIYNRYKSKDYISGEWIENGWSNWEPFMADVARKAIFDDTGIRFSSKYATKEELGNYATKEYVNEKILETGGHTPEKGVDYWTSEDIAEIKSYVDEAILGGVW